MSFDTSVHVKLQSSPRCILNVHLFPSPGLQRPLWPANWSGPKTGVTEPEDRAAQCCPVLQP